MRSRWSKEYFKEVGNTTYSIFLHDYKHSGALGIHVNRLFTIEKIKKIYAKNWGKPISYFDLSIRGLT